MWRVAWADPEFGENGILASCGYDKQVIIWSETEAHKQQQAPQNQAQQTKKWHKKTNFILKDSPQDIRFAPKHKGLMLAVAVANGTIKIYQWQDPTNLTSSNEFREINVIADSGECTCLTWNQAFDEPMALIVGCLMTKSTHGNHVSQDPADIDDDKNDENQAEDMLQSRRNDEMHLLQLITFNQQTEKELDRKIPMNGN